MSKILRGFEFLCLFQGNYTRGVYVNFGLVELPEAPFLPSVAQEGSAPSG